MPRHPRPDVRGDYILLNTAARLIQRRLDNALAPLGLTRAAVIALKAVSARHMNQEQLAAAVHVQSQTLGRVLARLEADGLVTRQRNPLDRRQFLVAITDTGASALQAALEAESVAAPTDYDGWETLRKELTHLVASFQAPPEAGP